MVIPQTNAMEGINSYGKELTNEEIDQKQHRNAVGGFWEELGQLQHDFLKAQGLKPFHTLLDIGCGCLRGGLHYINYLEVGNYYGLDVNRSLIQAGLLEVEEAGLTAKQPKLLVDDRFRLEQFNKQFDFMVSVSLFTHLPMNSIIRCLSAVRKQLKPNGVYFATFFEAPTSAYLEPLQHPSGGVVTNYDSDPFHYSLAELSWMAQTSKLTVKLIEPWQHPRDQKMVAFSVRQ